jgi:hypothetical protein
LPIFSLPQHYTVSAPARKASFRFAKSSDLGIFYTPLESLFAQLLAGGKLVLIVAHDNLFWPQPSTVGDDIITS